MTILSSLLLFFCLSIVDTKEIGLRDDLNNIVVIWYPLPITLKKLFASLNISQNITKHHTVCTHIPTDISEVRNDKAPLNENFLDLLTGVRTSYYEQKNTHPINIKKQENNNGHSNGFKNSTHINVQESKIPIHYKIVYAENDTVTTDYGNGSDISAYDVNLPTDHQLDPIMKNHEKQEQQNEDLYLSTENPIKVSTSQTRYEDSSVNSISEIETRIILNKTENISYSRKQQPTLIKQSTVEISKTTTTTDDYPETSTISELHIEDYTVSPKAPSHALHLLDTLLSNLQDTTISTEEVTVATDTSMDGISTNNYEFFKSNLKDNESLDSNETSIQKYSTADSLIDELLQLLIQILKIKKLL